MDQTKECRNCFATKKWSTDPSSEFTLGSNKRPLSCCKVCRSGIVYRAELEKKLRLNPDLYTECDDCDHIHRVTKTCNHCRKEALERSPRETRRYSESLSSNQ